MRQHVVSEWGRKLRGVATYLTNSAREIFGQSEPVAFSPRERVQWRDQDSADARTPTRSRNAGTNDRLPPRERRGRD
jgi:hypothetical protein